MAEKRKGKKRKEDYVPPGEEQSDKPTKEEFKVAKWMRNNVPIKKTKFINHNVEYFTAKRAVDALLESKWVTGDDPLFKTREDIVDYLHIMLVHKFFHRARKVPLTESELKGGKRKEKKEKTDDEQQQQKEKVTDAESSVVESKQEQQEIGKEKRKKKIRLDMHNDQRFVDGMDAYVWIYDPIPFHYWIIGTLTVLGAIGVCLFPLWPPSVRLGVYYLSVAAAGFLVTIIVLAVIRLIIFSLIWILTFGKHHLWILPNLTEDVGFFASFWPLYTYEYKGNGSKNKKDKKKKKDKTSDNEGDEDNERVEEIEKESEHIGEEQEEKKRSTPEEEKVPATTTAAATATKSEKVSESESESSQRSSTGKDFEIVDQDELET